MIAATARARRSISDGAVTTFSTARRGRSGKTLLTATAQTAAGADPATTSGPVSLRTKVSSAFAPLMDGFQANACPGSTRAVLARATGERRAKWGRPGGMKPPVVEAVVDAR